MARKRRRSSKKGKGFRWIGNLFGAIARIILKVLPFVIIVSAAAGLFLGVKQLLYADPGLAIKAITVEPPTSVSIEQRAQMEAVYLGKNILTVDLRKIAAELEKNPEIRYARVIRDLPSVLKVEVSRRKPIAFIQTSRRGDFGLVSDDGMILDIFGKPDPSLVVIEAYELGFRNPRIGMQIKNRGFVEAIKFLKLFWKDMLARRETISKVSIDQMGNVTITMGEGPDIKLGRQPASQIGDLEKIAHLLEGETRYNIDYIDLQFDNVIVKRRK